MATSTSCSRVAEGRAHLALDPAGTVAGTATIVLGYAEALAMARGDLDPADALAAAAYACAATAALVAGQDVLAEATARLGTDLDELTDPNGTGAATRADGPPRVLAGVPSPRLRWAVPQPGGRGNRRLVRPGRAALLDLARAGATVIGLARSTERLDKLATDLCTFSPGSETMTCDVADTAALRRVLDEVAVTQGPVDLLVNNAAQDPGIRLADITEDDFRRTFDVNFSHRWPPPWPCCPPCSSGRGIVINVSSDGGRLPSPARAPTLVQSRPVGLHRVHLVPARPQGGPPARGLPRVHGHGAGAGSPRPRPAPAPPADDSQRRDGVAPDPGPAGGPALEISVSGLIDAAMVFRSLMPRTYHRLRRHW